MVWNEILQFWPQLIEKTWYGLFAVVTAMLPWTSSMLRSFNSPIVQTFSRQNQTWQTSQQLYQLHRETWQEDKHQSCIWSGTELWWLKLTCDWVYWPTATVLAEEKSWFDSLISLILNSYLTHLEWIQSTPHSVDLCQIWASRHWVRVVYHPSKQSNSRMSWESLKPCVKTVHLASLQSDSLWHQLSS